MTLFKWFFGINLSFLLISSTGLANIIGSDFQTFNPTTDGLGYSTVESGEIHESGHFNLGLFLDFASNTLPHPANGPGTSDNNRMATNIHGAVGVIKGWSIGFSMTNMINETSDRNLSSFVADTGREAFRIDSKIRLVNNKTAKLGTLMAVTFNNIDNNPFLGITPGPALALGGFYERYSSRNLRWAANLGFRLRNSGDAYPGIGPIENQFFYSLGLNYLLSSLDTQLIGELYGSSPTNSPLNNTDREFSNLEALLGLKKKFYQRLSGQIGVTRGLYSGLATPDLRIYAGLNWYFGPPEDRARVPGQTGGKVPGYEFRDRDNDGIPDRRDRCAGTPPNTLVDRTGCPMVADRGILDDDFDGVDNAQDECPGTSPKTRVDDFGCAIAGGAVASLDEVDSDNDGVFDSYDLCPDTRRGVPVTDRGCEKREIQKIDLGQLNFITGTDQLTKRSRQRFMKKINVVYGIKDRVKKIVIEGHTDGVGSAAYNLKLSRLRARTIRRILIKQTGISANLVFSRGYGESRPIATNKTKKGRLLNRRVEMNVITK